MNPPGPFTLFAQAFSALWGVWSRLFMSRAEREMLAAATAFINATMAELDSLMARWKAGTLPPESLRPEPAQPETPPVAPDEAGETRARATQARTPGQAWPRCATELPQPILPSLVRAPRRRPRILPRSAIARKLGPAPRKRAVARMDEWSG